jgi:predicted PhzF superfamily epimerase YddE/YHI9
VASIVTAAGRACFEFHQSLLLRPAKGVDEDPVTGGAHCMTRAVLGATLGKDDFVARQASARGGTVRCALVGERVRA